MLKLNHFDVIGILLMMVWIVSYLLLNVGGGAVHVLLGMTVLFLVMGDSVKHEKHKRA